MINYIIFITIIVLAYKSLVFFLSLRLKRNDIADVSWGLSFVLILIASLFYTKNFSLVNIIVSLLVLIWGLRLALRIYLRNRAKKEDFRYKKLREEAGNKILIRSFLQVYILQGSLAVIVSAPVLIVSYFADITHWNILITLGILVWSVGFFFEVVGDAQLDRFLSKQENKGKIMKQGLWSFSRHPNYFGELTMWWGIFLIVVTTPNGWFSIVGPLAITFLITKVSGIPMLEKRYIGNVEFEKYKMVTSVLIPLPRKQK